MRKNVFGRQFKRDKNERTALFKGLISSLVLHERIKTTEDKAKAIKGEVDKIITKAKSDLAKAKKGEVLARHLLQKQLPKKEIEKVILEIAPRFNGRQGGYTRVTRIGRRFSDNAPMVLMEWTEQNEVKSSKLKVQSLDKKTATAGIQSREAGSGSARKKNETLKQKLSPSADGS